MNPLRSISRGVDWVRERATEVKETAKEKLEVAKSRLAPAPVPQDGVEATGAKNLALHRHPDDGVEPTGAATSLTLAKTGGEKKQSDLDFIKERLNRGPFDWVVTDGNIEDVHKRFGELVADPKRNANDVFSQLKDDELDRWRKNVADFPVEKRREVVEKLATELDDKNLARLKTVFGSENVPSTTINPITERSREIKFPSAPNSPVKVEYSESLEKNVERKNGFVKVEIDLEISKSLSGEGQIKKLTVGGGASQGERRSYELTLTEKDFERLKRGEIPPPDPRDPRTLPDKGSLRMEETSFVGVSQELGLDLRKGVSIGTSDEWKTGKGRSYEISREGNDVQVTLGPTEFFQHGGKLKLGVGPVNAFLGSTHSLTGYELRTATFDLGGTEGKKAFDEFSLSGKLPERDVTGVKDALRVERLSYQHAAEVGLELGSLDLKSTLSETDSSLTVVHNQDGTRTLSTETRTTPSSPLYTTERKLDKEGNVLPGTEHYNFTFETKDDNARQMLVEAFTGDRTRAEAARGHDRPITLKLKPEDVLAMKARVAEQPQFRIAGAFEAPDSGRMAYALSRYIQGEYGLAQEFFGLRALSGNHRPLAGELQGA